MTRAGAASRVAALASLPALPLCWFAALQAHPASVALAYLAYLLVVVAAPGTLLWRRLTGGSGWLAVDAVLDIRFCRLSCPPWPSA
jgi:hypothetical protein